MIRLRINPILSPPYCIILMVSDAFLFFGEKLLIHPTFDNSQPVYPTRHIYNQLKHTFSVYNMKYHYIPDKDSPVCLAFDPA